MPPMDGIRRESTTAGRHWIIEFGLVFRPHRSALNQRYVATRPIRLVLEDDGRIVSVQLDPVTAERLATMLLEAAAAEDSPYQGIAGPETDAVTTP